MSSVKLFTQIMICWFAAQDTFIIINAEKKLYSLTFLWKPFFLSIFEVHKNSISFLYECLVRLSLIELI